MKEFEKKKEEVNHKAYEELQDRLYSSDCSDLDLQDESDMLEDIYE